MKTVFKSIKKISKLILYYYFIAILFGLYNLYTNIALYKPLEIKIVEPLSTFAYIVVPFFLTLVILSIVIIIKTLKGNLSKINLTYPLYYLILWSISIVLHPIIFGLFSSDMAVAMLDVIGRFYFIFYIFDIVFPIYVINKLRKV